MGSVGVDPWPLVCRDDELARIDNLTNQGVVLAGEAGVGKSRMLAELTAREERAGRRVVRVVATRSLTSVPFGAFAGVLAGAPEAGAPFDVLQRAMRVFAGGGDLSEVVLSVDDAHLVDDASAGLVVLAAQQGARVLAAVRSREPAPEAINRLWKDEYARRIDLAPLDDEQVGVLLGVALGAPLDGRARRKFFEVTRGNLLFLRELVRHALLDETLVERGGVWSWTEPAADVPGVRDLVLERLAGVPEPVRELVDLLAVAEPLGAALVSELCSEPALQEAERSGVVFCDPSGVRRELRLVHPIYSDVVRESLGAVRRSALSLRVAERLAAAGARRHDDRLRVAVLRLDAGAPGDPAELNAATRDAFVRADTVLGERLARAGIAAGGSPESDILLGNVLYWSGRHEEVVELLGSGIVDTAPPEIAVHAALLVASSLFWGLGRFEDADRWLDHGVKRAGMPFALDLVGQRAQMLMFAGRAVESIEVGRTVLDDPTASVVARLRAYSGLLPSAATCGRIAEVEAEIPVAMGLVMQTGSDMAFTSGGVMVATFVARLFNGGLDQLDLLVRALHDDALRRVDDPFRGVWAFLLGRSALAQGRIADASMRLRDASSLLRDRDPGAMLPWALAALAQALGAAADAAGATHAVAELDAVRIATMHNIDVDVELGRAWAAAARGERSHAREIAEKIGRSLTEDGRVAIGALAFHDALRLGADPVVLVGALDAAAAACDGVIVDAFAAHVHALIDADADALLAAAELFETAGWRLHAAECAAGASRIAADQGRRDRQRDAATRSAALAAGCGPALTPMLETLAGKSALGTLTRREQEIALMAARGLSKREIADTLYLSPRTIGNHINHVYAKLGISSRDELRAAIGVDSIRD
jgi:DNA-binding CsgD family transcriptional regulator